MNISAIKDRVELADLFQARGYTVGAEVGTFEGGYACVLLQRVGLKKLYCVDRWDGFGMSAAYDGAKCFEKCRLNLSRFGQRVEMIRSDSLPAATMWQMRNLDFAYIDASHDYASVLADIRAWLPTVKSGGMLAGHDYSTRGGKGVVQAVHEVFGKSHYRTLERCASWYIFKP